MSHVAPTISDFFVAGGTLRTGVQSYVKRPADRDLLAATLAGEFCYVLTPRQMGKSSLMVRTARELQTAGVRTVILDLTSIGTDVTVEQWYLGIVSRINSRLNRSFDLASWWSERDALSVVQRFTDYLREILLYTEERVVIFIDEIDTTLSLDFRDDFFAAIRYFYNMRSDEPELERLSIALLGVATPADLIRDRSRTPFNIGRRIELHEFSRADAGILEQGLDTIYPGKGRPVFDRIFYWTNGHPYLTQKLCLAASEDPSCVESDDRVDALVHDLFLSDAARRETNLQFIRDNIVSQGAREQRRLLVIYRHVLRNRNVAEDERSPEQGRLKLIGLVKGNDNTLHVRNKIYQTVFDEKWIEETIPVDWNRRVAFAAVIVVVLMAAGIAYYIWNSSRQTAEQLIEEQVALFESGNPSVQLTSLDALFNYDADETIAKANELYSSLSHSERLALFNPEATAGLDSSLGTVAIAVTSRETNTLAGNQVLEELASALVASSDGENVLAGNGIQQWISGRRMAQAGDYQGAAGEYLDAEQLLSLRPVPGLFYDQAVAHTELGDLDTALSYLERVLDEGEYSDYSTQVTLPAWSGRVRGFAASRPELLGQWYGDKEPFPVLSAILPTPTSTPSPTPTPEPTMTDAPEEDPTLATEEFIVPFAPPPSETPSTTPTIPAEPSPAGSPILVVLRNANLRAGPGVEYPLITAVRVDMQMDILGRSPSGDWYNVIYLGQPAWISAGFIEVLGEQENIDVVATIPPRPVNTRTPSPPPAVPSGPTSTEPPSGGSSSGGSQSPPTNTPVTLPTNTPFVIP